MGPAYGTIPALVGEIALEWAGRRQKRSVLPAKNQHHDMQEPPTGPGDTAARSLALMQLCREQPQVGIAALYDHYGQLVFSVALRIVGDRGIAEEVTQDVFVNCWRNAERYHPERGSLMTWLVSMTHHRAIDELRSRRYRSHRQEVELQDHTLLDTSPHTDMEVRLLQTMVRSALAELPPPQREVIELIYFGGLSRQEVAHRLQTPLGTIHTRMRLGMSRLRQLLDRLLHEEPHGAVAAQHTDQAASQR